MAMRDNLSWDDSARWGRRLYVLGVSAAATFLVALLAWGALDVPFDKLRAGPPRSTPQGAAVPQDRAADGSRENPLDQVTRNLGLVQGVRRDLVRARAALTAAETELFEFLNRQFTSAQDEMSPPAGTAPAVSAPIAVQLTQPLPAPTPVQPTDPKWASLEQKLQQAEAQREKLLVALQPSHPSVLAVDDTIAELRTLLGKRPAAAVAPAAPPVEATALPNPSPVEPLQPAAVRPVDDWLTPEARDQYNRLLMAAGKARARYEALFDRERRAWREFGAVVEEQGSRPTATTPHSPAISEPSTAPLGMMIGSSLIIAAVLAAGVRRQPRYIRSRTELEQLVQAPVLAHLPAVWSDAAAPAKLADKSIDPAWVRGGLVASHWALAIAAGVIAVLTVIDQPLARELVLRPLAGIL